MKDKVTVRFMKTGSYRSKRSFRAIGSLVDIYPAPSPAPKVKIGGGFEEDQERLSSDWNKVGASLYFAFESDKL